MEMSETTKRLSRRKFGQLLGAGCRLRVSDLRLDRAECAPPPLLVVGVAEHLGQRGDFRLVPGGRPGAVTLN